jgi:hypothetical protein
MPEIIFQSSRLSSTFPKKNPTAHPFASTNARLWKGPWCIPGAFPHDVGYISDILYGQTKSNEAKSSPSEPVQSTDTQDEREAKYLTDIDSIGDSFYINKTFYSLELESIGEKLRTASDEQDLAEAYEEVIPLLQDVASRSRQDLDDTRLIPPVPRFKEFHLLLVDAIDDAHGSAQAFLTLYSMVRNSGVIDGDIASRASELHKSANQKSLEAGYMFRELCPKCD